MTCLVLTKSILSFLIGMDYEGIYRKTGGSSQSKAITQLFERGNYEAFDLRDTDAFNDISSVTSVLKNYFRALPNPLLTFELHSEFVQAAGECLDVSLPVISFTDVLGRLDARSERSAGEERGIVRTRAQAPQRAL